MPASDQGLAHSAKRYTLIPRTLVFVRRGDEVLLLKGAPTKKIWATKYNGLGGHIERGETPHAAAAREVQEEAGLDMPDLRLCGVITVDVEPEKGIGIFVFTGTAPTRRVTASPEGAPEWIKRKNLAQLPLVEDLPTLLPVVLARRPVDPVFTARYAYDSAGQLQITFSGLHFAPQDVEGQLLTVGRRVRLVQVPPSVAETMPLETRRVFRQAVGQTFRISGFNEYGLAELQVSRVDTIWVEPAYLARL